jgi:hypothetical protein
MKTHGARSAPFSLVPQPGNKKREESKIVGRGSAKKVWNLRLTNGTAA